MRALFTEVTYCGQAALIACDRKCEKAWGINGRRRDPTAIIEFDEDDRDDVAYAADSSSGRAPDYPGTYEGGDMKPMHPEVHNRWCVRECERSSMIAPGKPICLTDFSQPVYNIPSRHKVENAKIDLGRLYSPSDPFVHAKSWTEPFPSTPDK